MLAPPPYRFKGSVAINDAAFTFKGYDEFSNEMVEFNIAKEDINQLYHGYDETFNTFQTRGMGLTWAPIRIRFGSSNVDKEENDLYVVCGFNGAFSKNEALFEQLKIWLS